MKGDFSRFTYDKYKNYIGLLRQQGHVLLDSDWNEQSFLWAENFRQLARDILGQFAIPLNPNEITKDNSSALKISRFSIDSGGMIDFKISRGLAYIAGFPFILAKDCTFRNQPDYPEPESAEIKGDVLVYIEVWHKTVDYIEDSFIREPILGGPDTCLRARLVGQIKTVSSEGLDSDKDASNYLSKIFASNPATLTAKIDYSGRQIPLSFGEIEAAGGYSVQNLHMRLEFHRGVGSNGGFSEGLKWSDENCATAAPVHKTVDPNSVLIEEPEAVSGASLNKGDMVEVGNLITELHRHGGQLARIKNIKQVDDGHLIELDSEIHPLLRRSKMGGKSGSRVDLAPRIRRWSGYISPITPEKQVSLGKGIKITIHAPAKNMDIIPGDFWTFAIRDKDYNRRYFPLKSSPDGVRVYRFPLAIIRQKGKNRVGEIIDCRKFFNPISSLKL
jgi:hypothetical protein